MYIYFHCDEWKSRNSMSLIGVFDEEHLRLAVSEDLKRKDVELEGFHSDDEADFSIDELINNLDYAFIQRVSLNERL